MTGRFGFDIVWPMAGITFGGPSMAGGDGPVDPACHAAATGSAGAAEGESRAGGWQGFVSSIRLCDKLRP